MKKISIVNTRDQAIEINLPEDPSEVPIRKFIDYSMAYEGFFDWYNELAISKQIALHLQTMPDHFRIL